MYIPVWLVILLSIVFTASVIFNFFMVLFIYGLYLKARNIVVESNKPKDE